MEEVVDFVREEYVEGETIVEVGIGKRDETACALSEAGFELTATDTRCVEDDVGEAFEFVRDDVASPDAEVYEGASLVYSLRPPYEIHAEVDEIARSVGAGTLLVPLADEGTPLDLELINHGGRAFFFRRS